MPLWGFVVCFLCAALWAASPLMVSRGMVMSGCSGLEIVRIRSLAFFASSLAIALISGQGRAPLVTDPVVYLYLFIGSTMSFIIGDSCYFAAIQAIGVSLAIPVANSSPVFVVFTAWLLLGEQATARIFMGVTVVVAGLILLHTGAMNGGGDPMDKTVTPGKRRVTRGFLFAFGAALAWSVGTPFTKLALLRSGLGPVDLTFYRALTLIVTIWVWRFVQLRYTNIKTKPLKTVPRDAWFYFAGAAVIGLSFGSMLYIASIRVMPVAIAVAITSTSPFMSALYGHFALKDRLRPLQWIGVVMIIIGSVVMCL